MRKVIREWVDRYLSDEEAVLLALLLVALVGLLWWLGGVLAPVIASLLIAYILQGVVKTLVKFGIHTNVAIGASYLLFLGFFFLIAFFVVPPVWNQMGAMLIDLPEMMQNGQRLMMGLPEHYPAWVNEQQILDLFEYINAEVGSYGERVLSYSLGQLPGLLGLLVYVVLVPILVFFLLRDWSLLVGCTKVILPTKRKALSAIMKEMDEQIANYIRGKALEILIVGGAAFGLFTVFGLRYATLLALAVGFSVLIPYVGAFLVTLPIAIVAFFQWGWGATFAWLMTWYIILQILDGNVLVPLIFSEIVNLHPVAIIMAILVFGGLWGFWGVFFAIPLATLVKAIINAWPINHPITQSSDNSV